MSGLDLLVDRLRAQGCRPKQSGGKWSARCPAHDDHNPSLSFGAGTKGADVIVKCQAGCDSDDVITALDLSWSDLSPAQRTNGQRAEPDATYDYVNEQGELLFQVVRFPGKEFRQRRPDGKGGWTWKLGSARRVLYRLPEVVEAVDQGLTVFVVEGEKDADRLARDGHVATTCPGGAGKWRDDYSKVLSAADVVIVADKDEPGRRHAEDVKLSLLEAGAARIRTVEAHAGKDAFDHLEAGHSAADFDVIDDTEPEPIALTVVTAETFGAVDEQGADALLGDADSILIPANGDVMVYGDGGAGKTTLTLDMAVHLAAGDDWLGIPVSRPLRVLLIEDEGPRPLFRRKIARKLDAWAGSTTGNRLQVIEDPWAAFTFADPGHRQALADVTAEHDLDVVIVGPVTVAGMNEAGTLQETRAFQALLTDVRRRAGRHVTIVLIHHESKVGKVSGAWEGTGDTLLHVTGVGHGRTRLYIQKARWSTDHHATTLNLRWAPGESFEVEEAPELDDDTLAEAIVDYVANHPGTGWTDVEGATPGVAKKRRRQIRDRLLKDGQLVNVGKVDGTEARLDHIPPRKAARLHLPEDPTIRYLRPDPGADGAQLGLAGGGDEV